MRKDGLEKKRTNFSIGRFHETGETLNDRYRCLAHRSLFCPATDSHYPAWIIEISIIPDLLLSDLFNAADQLPWISG